MHGTDTAESTFTEQATSRTVQTKKWRLHYHELGVGYPIIMLHGSGPGANGWSNFSSNCFALSKRYRVILMDFPGWGQSDELDASAFFRWTANAEAIKLLMDELGIEKAALVGNSMGGMAAQMFTAMYNDRISHCITMGAPAPIGPQYFFSPSGISEGLKVLFDTYLEPTPKNFRKLINIMVYDDSFATEELIEQRTQGALANPKHLENFINGIPLLNQQRPEVANLAERLAAVATPALIIHGRDDRVINVENSLRTATIFQNSTLLVFNRCGHWAQLEHAAKFNTILDGFISATTI